MAESFISSVQSCQQTRDASEKGEQTERTLPHAELSTIDHTKHTFTKKKS